MAGTYSVYTIAPVHCTTEVAVILNKSRASAVRDVKKIFCTALNFIGLLLFVFLL
jgi:hypothetical protein